MSSPFITKPIEIQVAEYDCSYVRSSGPGGQNVNKVNSKCILRWNILKSPSITEEVRARFLSTYASKLTNDGDILISSDRHRDQKRNYDDCVNKLSELLNAVARPPKIRRKTKPSKGSKKRLFEGKKAHSEKKALRRKF